MTQNVQLSQGVLPPKPNLLNESLKCGDIDFVRLAQQKNILPDIRTLTCAFMSERVEVIEYTRNTLLTVPDDKTLTTAVASNKVALVRLAISYWAVATDETFLLAQKINNPEILALLKSAPRSVAPLPQVNRVPDSGPDNEVTRASKIGSVQAVERALQTQPVQRQTLLAAAESGEGSIVHQVIQKGAVPHRVPGKKSELSAACQAGDLDMVNELIIAGAEPDKTTLSLAYASKKMAIVDAVLKAGARGDEDPNCLTIAVQNFPRDKGAIRKALKAGAKPNNSQNGQNTLNCLIQSSGSEEVCKVLLDGGARPVNSTNEHHTLNLALNKRFSSEFCQVLINGGAKPCTSSGPHNSLDIALGKNYKDYDFLIEAHAKGSGESLSKIESSNHLSVKERDTLMETAFKAGGATLSSKDTKLFDTIASHHPHRTAELVAAGGKPSGESIGNLIRNTRDSDLLSDKFYNSLLSLVNAGATFNDHNWQGYIDCHVPVKYLSSANKSQYEKVKALLKRAKN